MSKFMGTVKVGPKGQVVIPKEIREMFNIKPGDNMLILADSEQGIALNTYSIVDHLMDKSREKGADLFKAEFEKEKEKNL